MAGNANSGRKSLKEELEMYRERLKEQTLEEVAGMKVFNHLENLEETDRQGVKDIALPVYLKSKADRLDINVQQVIIKRANGNEGNTTIQSSGQSDIQPAEIQGDSSGVAGS